MASHDLFLSCVSDEFHKGDPASFASYRTALEDRLHNAGFHVEVQEHFTEHGGDLLHKLEDYIRDCRVVIHLVGDMTGATAKADEVTALLTRHPGFLANRPELRSSLGDFSGLSYTQWEALLAIQFDRPLLRYECSSHAIRSPSYRDDPAQKASQRRHWDRLKNSGLYPGTFNGQENLCLQAFEALTRAKLLDGLSPHAKPNNLPFASLGNLFVGRTDFLDTLRRTLTGPGGPAAAITQPAAIHALGGQGKTRAALEYAWQHQADYGALLFVSAPTPEQMRKSIADLCGCLRIPKDQAPEDNEPARYAAALDWLQSHPHWLLLLDNVDTPAAAAEVRATLSKLTKGHVIITSRLADWRDGVQPLELMVLAPEAGADLILKATEGYRITEPEEATLARSISEDQGHLALGLQQAAAYIARLRIKLSTYRTEWQEKRAAVLQKGRKPTDYPAELLTTWDVTFEHMTLGARALLERLAWLAPEPVPRSFIGKLPLPEGTDAEDSLAELLDWHFLTTAENSEDVQAHRLVLEITRQHLTERGEEKMALQDALTPLGKACYLDTQDVRNWPELDSLRPHLAESSTHAVEQGQLPLAIRLKNLLARLYDDKALYSLAEPHFCEALQMAETHLGGEHALTSMVLNNFAGMLHTTNRSLRAEVLYRRALAIDEKNYGPDSPVVASTLNNLAELLRVKDGVTEAEPLYRRALKIYENTYGDEHPEVARPLNNLALLLQATNRASEAELVYRRVIPIFESSFGSDHPNVAAALSNLGVLLRATSRFEEAEPLLRRALAIDKMSYGPNHPLVAIRSNNLATLLHSINRLSEAELLYRRALAILENSYGRNHPLVATNLNNISQLLQATNRQPEAEPLLRRALAIDEISYGPDHSNVARDLNNLATFSANMNQIASAEQLLRRSLLILARFRNAVGHEDPHWQGVKQNYIRILLELELNDPLVALRLEAIEGGEDPGML